MFLHLSVSHSVHGVCIPACIGADTPSPWQTPPGQTPPLLGRHPPGQTHPLPPGQIPPSMHAGIHTPLVATAADGMHPTGMHTC